MKIAIIGGGAAGFFAAIHASGPGNEVTIFEKSPKILSKVRISGGGRCNVTHQPMEISKLIKNYPRGEKFLKKAFRHFSISDTFKWFESRGVSLKIESDGRVFPITDDSQTIIHALVSEADKLDVKQIRSTGIKDIKQHGDGFDLISEKGHFFFDKVIVAAGGHPNLDSYGFLKSLNHKIVKPIPSLFTFNAPNESIRELMGISMPNAQVKIEGTKLTYQGPVLITHWGISGPAVLKLSAFGAQWLFDHQYQAKAQINWNAELGEGNYLNQILNYSQSHPYRKIYNHPLFEVPSRLWEHFCGKSGIEEGQLFGNLPKKSLNRLVQNLFCYILEVKGKTTFKEEFVTAGGISLEEVNPDTMQSIYHPNLYFAGEVLNLDGITGGFNFQAAWTTGYIAGVSAKL
ncbi:MAG: NAD(P)/FAD-dependent oxidoreductase [Algoriphagus aquaeductus]|uniref:NAD(P)/FAD-dependent oxidoreductase n=1 Tax=Algoriphagus aquaeductus TaxID=475299 RepID=UPI003919DACC